MIDFKSVKKLAIPEGVVKSIKRTADGVLLWKSGVKNWVTLSTESDGKTIFNGGLGYKNNTRLNSSAAEVSLSGYVTFGFIPVKPGDIVRVKGVQWDSSTNTGCYLWYYNSSFTQQKYLRPNSGTTDVTWSNGANGEVVFRFSTSGQLVGNCAYFRFSAYGDGANAIVTVNEEIV